MRLVYTLFLHLLLKEVLQPLERFYTLISQVSSDMTISCSIYFMSDWATDSHFPFFLLIEKKDLRFSPSPIVRWFFRITLQSFQKFLRSFTSKTAFSKGAKQEKNHFEKQMQGRHSKAWWRN